MNKTAFVVVLLLGVAAPHGSQAALPDTPAGRRLTTCLAVLNRADPTEVTRFQREAFDEPSDPQRMLRIRQQSGGFVFERLEESTETKIVAVLRGRSDGRSVVITVETEPGPPYRITDIGLRPASGTPASPVTRLSESAAIAAGQSEADQRASRDDFSGALLIAKGGTVLFTRAYGLADRERRIANTGETKFRLGSMNKMFTAVAIAQLAETGKLSFADLLATHVPDYPNKDFAEKVTVHQLLTHTGGAGDIFGPEYQKNRDRLRQLSDYIEVYGSRPPEFEPGTRFSYSNYGYILLGMIIERVSGQSYYDYVREHIYRVAGMASTDSFAEDVPGLAVGYMRDGAGWKPNTATLPPRGTSAGGGYSTVADLWRFARALLDQKLLNATDTEIVTTGKTQMGPGARYGYGFGDIEEGDVRFIGHNGGAPGMNAEFKIYPRSGYVVVVLANIDPPVATELAKFIGLRLPVS